MDPTLMIHDVQEKEVGTVKAPSFPQPKSATTGFPEHKKRTRVSAFKQKREAQNAAAAAAAGSPTVLIDRPPPSGPSSTTTKPGEDERKRIDRENRQVLAAMSPEQIAEARQEVFEGLDPSILQMLLKRANLDEPSGPSPFDIPTTKNSEPAAKADSPPEINLEDTTETLENADRGHATKAKKPTSTEQKPKTAKKVTFDEDAAPPETPSDLFSPSELSPPTTNTDDEPTNTTHFPQPAQLPDLDPSDPDFLETLHKKFFPSLPADPSRLAWIAPLPTPNSTADRESPYYPGQTSLPVSALRFDFRGRLLPPRASRAIPVSKGLHHHGEAPEAAGYTVPELARLARSAVPAQRCVAFQTLGRILYRLGKGEWGGGESDVAMGVWRTAQENRVMDSLLEAADVPEGVGHRGSRAYAIEALWLFEKGGWREKWRGR